MNKSKERVLAELHRIIEALTRCYNHDNFMEAGTEVAHNATLLDYLSIDFTRLGEEAGHKLSEEWWRKKDEEGRER